MRHQLMCISMALALCGILEAEGQPTPECLGKQFDAQVARLTERGYPKMFGEPKIFDAMMAKLREEAVQYVPTKPGYTFLVVIPENDAPLLWQIRQIVLPTGEDCEIRDHCFTNRARNPFMNNGDFTTPAVPYLIYDVDVGDDTKGTWVANAGYSCKGRRGLTATECTAFLMQYPETLASKKVAATGTVVDYHSYHDAYGQFVGWKLSTDPPHHPFAESLDCKSYNNPNKGWAPQDAQFPSCREDCAVPFVPSSVRRNEEAEPPRPVRDQSKGRYWLIDELTPLFDAQVHKLQALGYADLFGGEDPCSWLIGSVSADGTYHTAYPESLSTKYARDAPVWVDEGNIPLLIVIPETYAPYRWQTRHVKAGGIMSEVPGFSLARLEQPGVRTPQYPYLIYNVNPGTDTAHTSVDNVECELAEADRSGLTFAEGIALLTHYPDAIRCEQGTDEDYREHYAFGNMVFLEARDGGPCPCDKTAEEYVTFTILKDTPLSRGRFIPIIRRDMRPNYTRFIFPSCDLYAPQPR